MTTDYLEQKLNMVENNIASRSVQKLEHEIVVRAAQRTTGDKTVDDQFMAPGAETSRKQILLLTRLIEEFTVERDSLKAQITALQNKPA